MDDYINVTLNIKILIKQASYFYKLKGNVAMFVSFMGMVFFKSQITVTKQIIVAW